MCELLIFGGTTEGRELCEFCAENGIPAAVSVATEYGGELLPDCDKLRIMVGRLTSAEMERGISELGCKLIVDATHPYAAEVTENIKRACQAVNMPYYRLLRSSLPLRECQKVRNMEELVELLNGSEKVVLSTLGSKELPKLTQVRGYEKRLFVRVLPNEGVIGSCQELGIEKGHIIAEKGPFSVQQNISHIRQCGAELLVTKESGAAGGFPEKLEAAKYCGIEVVVVERPQENGQTMEEIKKIIGEVSW